MRGIYVYDDVRNKKYDNKAPLLVKRLQYRNDEREKN